MIIVNSRTTIMQAQTGRSVISSEKASDYLPPADRIQELTEDTEE